MLLRYKPHISPYPGFTETLFLTQNQFPHRPGGWGRAHSLSIMQSPPGALAWKRLTKPPSFPGLKTHADVKDIVGSAVTTSDSHRGEATSVRPPNSISDQMIQKTGFCLCTGGGEPH